MHIWCDLMSKMKTKSKYKAYPGNGLQHNHQRKQFWVFTLFSKLGNFERKKGRMEKKEKFCGWYLGTQYTNVAINNVKSKGWLNFISPVLHRVTEKIWAHFYALKKSLD